MITIFTALPGGGKSLRTAKVALDVLWRNMNYHKKSGTMRYLWSNLRFSEAIEAVYGDYIRYWVNPSELVKLRDCDVIWDEMATHMDSTQWTNMSLELKRWLQQHRKFGIDIYGNTQDFAQIDKSFRRLCSDLIHLTKLIGSRDKSSTRPEVKYIWGISLVQHLDPQKYDEENKNSSAGLPWFMVIRRNHVEIFDTTAEVAVGKYPPLRHIARECEDRKCGHVKTLHV